MRIIFFVLFSLFFVCATSFAQESDKFVSVSLTHQEDKAIYTFIDQRNIPEENTSGFASRIGNLYPNVEVISYNSADKTFSITFLIQPAIDELNNVFGHFNVYQYELN